MSFWGELRRSNVFKVSVAYAIVAWFLVQIPEWTLSLVKVLLIIGFPVSLILAWTYEVTPEVVKRTKQELLSQSIRDLTGQRLNYVVMALLVLAVAVLIIDNYTLERDTIEPVLVSIKTERY